MRQLGDLLAENTAHRNAELTAAALDEVAAFSRSQTGGDA